MRPLLSRTDAPAGVLEPAQVVDPRPRRVHDEPRIHRDLLVACGDLRTSDAAVEHAEGDHTGAVEHASAGLGCGADVGKAEARVIRRRIRVERAGAKPLSTQ